MVEEKNEIVKELLQDNVYGEVFIYESVRNLLSNETVRKIIGENLESFELVSNSIEDKNEKSDSSEDDDSDNNDDNDDAIDFVFNSEQSAELDFRKHILNTISYFLCLGKDYNEIKKKIDEIEQWMEQQKRNFKNLEESERKKYDEESKGNIRYRTSFDNYFYNIVVSSKSFSEECSDYENEKPSWKKRERLQDKTIDEQEKDQETKLERHINANEYEDFAFVDCFYDWASNISWLGWRGRSRARIIANKKGALVKIFRNRKIMEIAERTEGFELYLKEDDVKKYIKEYFIREFKNELREGVFVHKYDWPSEDYISSYYQQNVDPKNAARGFVSFPRIRPKNIKRGVYCSKDKDDGREALLLWEEEEHFVRYNLDLDKRIPAVLEKWFDYSKINNLNACGNPSYLRLYHSSFSGTAVAEEIEHLKEEDFEFYSSLAQRIKMFLYEREYIKKVKEKLSCGCGCLKKYLKLINGGEKAPIIKLFFEIAFLGNGNKKIEEEDKIKRMGEISDFFSNFKVFIESENNYELVRNNIENGKFYTTFLGLDWMKYHKGGNQKEEFLSSLIDQKTIDLVKGHFTDVKYFFVDHLFHILEEIYLLTHNDDGYSLRALVEIEDIINLPHFLVEIDPEKLKIDLEEKLCKSLNNLIHDISFLASDQEKQSKVDAINAIKEKYGEFYNILCKKIREIPFEVLSIESLAKICILSHVEKFELESNLTGEGFLEKWEWSPQTVRLIEDFYEDYIEGRSVLNRGDKRLKDFAEDRIRVERAEGDCDNHIPVGSETQEERLLQPQHNMQNKAIEENMNPNSKKTCWQKVLHARKKIIEEVVCKCEKPKFESSHFSSDEDDKTLNDIINLFVEKGMYIDGTETFETSSLYTPDDVAILQILQERKCLNKTQITPDTFYGCQLINDGCEDISCTLDSGEVINVHSTINKVFNEFIKENSEIIDGESITTCLERFRQEKEKEKEKEKEEKIEKAKVSGYWNLVSIAREKIIKEYAKEGEFPAKDNNTLNDIIGLFFDKEIITDQDHRARFRKNYNQSESSTFEKSQLTHNDVAMLQIMLKGGYLDESQITGEKCYSWSLEELTSDDPTNEGKLLKDFLKFKKNGEEDKTLTAYFNKNTQQEKEKEENGLLELREKVIKVVCSGGEKRFEEGGFWSKENEKENILKNIAELRTKLLNTNYDYNDVEIILFQLLKEKGCLNEAEISVKTFYTWDLKNESQNRVALSLGAVDLLVNDIIKDGFDKFMEKDSLMDTEEKLTNYLKAAKVETDSLQKGEKTTSSTPSTPAPSPTSTSSTQTKSDSKTNWTPFMVIGGGLLLLAGILAMVYYSKKNKRRE